MILRSRRVFSASAAALALAFLALAPALQAASINYGSFGPVAPGLTFTDVTESSGTDAVPLYGAPTTFVTGLDFNPKNFVASATSGSADITDGQLNFGVSGQVNGADIVAIRSISLGEGGDFTLLGTGTTATQVVGGAILKIKVTEIDGVAVTPIDLSPSNASVAYNLVANAGAVQPWSLGILVDVEAQLTSLGVPFIVGATKADVVVNNQLTAISEPSTVAFIAKKDFVIGVVPELGTLPEPGTLGMAGLALCGIGAASRRKRS